MFNNIYEIFTCLIQLHINICKTAKSTYGATRDA